MSRVGQRVKRAAASLRQSWRFQAVGDGIKGATVLDPFGNVFGIIENPHFKLEEVR